VVEQDLNCIQTNVINYQIHVWKIIAK